MDPDGSESAAGLKACASSSPTGYRAEVAGTKGGHGVASVISQHRHALPHLSSRKQTAKPEVVVNWLGVQIAHH